MGVQVVCKRCQLPVSFINVADGYYAVCEKHDEDLFQFETETVEVECKCVCSNHSDEVNEAWRMGLKAERHRILEILDDARLLALVAAMFKENIITMDDFKKFRSGLVDLIIDA